MITRRLARGAGLVRQASYAPPDTQQDFYAPGEGRFGLVERMSPEAAISIPTVYACIRILAETVGSTPILAYTENGDQRERDRNSNAWYLLHERPNNAHTPSDLWTLVASWLVGWGDAFLGKGFAGNGELVSLWPIHPQSVTVELRKGVKHYEVAERGGPKEYGPGEIIHIMGQSFGGLRGSSPLRVARAEFETARAAQQYAAAVYNNTGVPRGALKVDHALTDEAAARLRADWNRIYGGTKNAGKVAILEEGLDFAAISIPLRDVQFVEQQQLSVQVIARIFRVPLSLIQADSGGGLTYKTAETENLQFLTHAIRPWYVSIEQALNADPHLFPTAPVSFCEFLPAALLRVATRERFEAYSIATAGAPWMLPSEVRRAENMPRAEAEGELDTRLTEVEPKGIGVGVGGREEDPQQKRRRRLDTADTEA